MPRQQRKGHGGRSNRFIDEAVNDGKSGYYNHDIREGGGNGQRNNFRGSVKSGKIERQRPKSFDQHRFQKILEEDVDMAGGTSQGSDVHQRLAPYKGRGRRGRDNPHTGPRNAHNALRTVRSDSNLWSKVTIPHGKKYEKEMLLKTLLNAGKHPFIPIYYHFEGPNAVFFIEDRVAADAVYALNRKITLADGFKLVVNVRDSPAPSLPINEDLRTRIKEVMSKRYDVVTKMLDLSQFHLDPDLALDYYAPLSRDNVMQAVVNVIGENIPDVQAIDASSNKIFGVEQMKPLVTKAVNLRSLNLAANKLASMSALDRIQGMGIEELILDRNPVCDQFNDRSAYITAVRKRFPKLVKLDGIDLPPVISFDVGAEDVSMPASSRSYFVSEEAQRIVLLFLEQYLGVYDSDDRQPLLNAYHDSAVMSLTVSFAPNQHASASSRLDGYLKDSRNLKRVDDPQRRVRLLHQGKVDVVSFLSKLPNTLHDPASLIVDVPVFSAHLITASVTGLFRERSERQTPLRWMQRILVLVPHNGGFVIVNEQVHISSATADQVKIAFKGAVDSAPAVTTEVVAAVPSVPVASVDPVLRQQLVVSFAEQSGMNAEWSKTCLEQNGWDFERAAKVFMELKNNNSIPPEAFIK